MRSIATRFAIGLTVASYAAWGAGLVLAPQRAALVESGRSSAALLLDAALFSIAWLGLPLVGCLLLVRQRGNRVGWAVLALGAAMYVGEPVESWVELVVLRGDEPAAGLLGAASVVNAAAVVPLVALVALLLLFPNGDLGPRARWTLRAVTALGGLVFVLRLLRPERLDMEVVVDNPFGQAWLAGAADLVGTLSATLILVAVATLALLVVRYRRAGVVERKQFQWILASLATLPPVWVLGNAIESVNYEVGQFTTVLAFDLAFLGFSVALYRAVSRSNLFGIDRLVSRTITYALLSGVLAATYLGLVLALGAAARSITGESDDLVVALSTLAVAALFQAARRRVGAIVDRRFDRGRYDATQTIDAFGRGLRDEVSLDAVADDLCAVTVRTFRPSAVGLVLMGGDG